MSADAAGHDDHTDHPDHPEHGEEGDHADHGDRRGHEHPAHRTVWFVRHSEAGRRGQWSGPDRERPLSPEGRRQAELLVPLLLAFGVERARRVLTSPYPRCRQTVEPLAAELGLVVEEDEALAEGAPLPATLALLTGGGEAVMCTHGDVMGNVIELLQRHGMVTDSEPEWPKGCTWILRITAGEIDRAEYLAPPPV